MKSQVRSALVCLVMVLVLALGFIPTLGITASAADEYTVSYSTPAGVTAPTAETVAAGESVTLPTVEAAKEGYTFVGWATGTVADTTTAPELFTESYTPTADVTLYAVFSYTDGTSGWALTDITAVKPTDVVVITMTYQDTVYAMSNDKGTSSAPVGVTLSMANGTISGDVADNLLWNIDGTAGAYIIYPNGTTAKWLYATNTNNGVRVGTNANKNFSVNGTHLYNTATNRYLGVFRTNPDWRCYTSVNDNIKNETLGIYVLTSGTTYYTTDSCTHAQTDVRTIPATCMTDGATETYCVDCNVVVSSVVIEATGHDYDEGVVTTEPTCTTKGVKTYTCNNGCNQAKTEDIDALGHAYTDGACSVCGAVDPMSVNYSGRYYIATVRSSGNYFYMTNDLGTASTKRYQAVDSGLAELPASITAPDATCVFVVEQNEDGTYCIYVEGVDADAKYLGWTSGNSGALVTKDNAKKLTIDLLESGLYNVYFDDRYLSLNGTANNDYFAWYAGTQKQDLALIPVAEAEEEEVKTEISDVNVNLGASLAMKYYVSLANGESIADYKLVVTMNGETVTITEYTEKDGKYVFAFTGIAPQCMTDTIKAELVKGDEVVSVKENYSVAQYAKELIALYPDDAELYALVADMIFYGTAAQLYKEYNVENLASSYLPAGAGQSDVYPSQDGNTPVMDESKNADVFFKAAGVWFDNVNKIYVKFTANAENVTVKANGKELAVESLGGDQYIVYTDGVYATAFDEMVTFELVVDGETVQTLQYSINCYCASKANFETTMGELALALYVYGVSAEAYAAKN